MNQRTSFYRKMAYVGGIAVLLWLLHLLGEPPIAEVQGRKGSDGGLLARVRAEHGLSEAQLGEIDPASVTVKLATFGLGGVASNILWTKATDYKMKKDWTNLSATLEQIIKLEPHFIEVWKHQGWNLAYNVSAEFDDYRERFRWVNKGIDFLKEGLEKNRKEPRLAWYIGWVTAQKIGRSDERVQFRRLYKDPGDVFGIHVDKATGESRPLDQRDNWLVGKEWFTKAEQYVDEGAKLHGMSPVIFYSDRPMCQANYADALEEEGIFKSKAQHAWKKAYDEWSGTGPEFGARDIATAYDTTIHLNDLERLEKAAKDLVAQLDALQPGLRDQMISKRREELTSAQKEALKVELTKRNNDQHREANAAEAKLAVTHQEVADAIADPGRKAKARSLLGKIMETEQSATVIRRYRDIVNFNYWRRRAQVEQTLDAREAREGIYDGRKLFADAKLPEAKAAFEKGLAKWRKVLDDNPGLVEDIVLGEDLIDGIYSYRRLLEAMSLPAVADKDFILHDVIRLHGHRD